MEKKRIIKEDGRYLVYYHFPETATAEETQVFAAVTEGEAPPNEANRASAPPTEDAKRV